MARKRSKGAPGRDTKDHLITVRVKPEIARQFKAAAQLRGSSMSGQIHQFMVRLIREEREHDPNGFAELLVRVIHEEEAREAEDAERKKQSSLAENDEIGTDSLILMNAIEERRRSQN